jgi:hypothetical protein
MIMRVLSYLCVAAVFTLLHPSVLLAQSAAPFAPVSLISYESFGSVVDHGMLLSFGLSPDGKHLAVLALPGGRANAPLWLVILDTSTKKLWHPGC